MEIINILKRDVKYFISDNIKVTKLTDTTGYVNILYTQQPSFFWNDDIKRMIDKKIFFDSGKSYEFEMVDSKDSLIIRLKYFVSETNFYTNYIPFELNVLISSKLYETIAKIYIDYIRIINPTKDIKEGYKLLISKEFPLLSKYVKDNFFETYYMLQHYNTSPNVLNDNFEENIISYIENYQFTGHEYSYSGKNFEDYETAEYGIVKLLSEIYIDRYPEILATIDLPDNLGSIRLAQNLIEYQDLYNNYKDNPSKFYESNLNVFEPLLVSLTDNDNLHYWNNYLLPFFIYNLDTSGLSEKHLNRIYNIFIILTGAEQGLEETGLVKRYAAKLSQENPELYKLLKETHFDDGDIEDLKLYDDAVLDPYGHEINFDI